MRVVAVADTLFLERVRISNFRAYSPDFEVALPAGPGVTVLSGPNGLGKTSLFEAIEWALTGNVRRLSTFTKNKLDPRCLVRRGSGNTCEVSLVFSGDVHVRRLLTVGATTTVVGSELAEVAGTVGVADSRWRVTADNLADYLHLTHFHPQAAELRLVSGKPGDRWLRISPLAGADRFDRFRANLRNARTGLTKVISEREKVVFLAEERAQSWKHRVGNLRALSAMDRAVHGALSPPVAFEALLPTALLLGQSIDAVDRDSSESVAKLLANLKTGLEQVLSSGNAIEARLSALGELPSAWMSARASLGAIRERQENAQKRQQEAAFRAANSARVVEERASEQLRVAAASTQAEQRHRLAVSLQLNEHELVRVKEQLTALEAQQEQLQIAINAKQLDLQSAVAALRQVEADVATMRALQDSIKSAQTALSHLAEAQDLDRQLAQQQMRVAAKASQLGIIRDGVAALEIELRATKEQRASIVSQLDAEASRLGELSQLVAAIATHLFDYDETCPVCKTDFPGGGLRERALQQIASASAAMAEFQQELQVAERNVVYLESRVSELAAQRHAAEQEVASLSAISAQLMTRIGVLRSSPVIGQIEGAESRLMSELADRESELAAILLRIEASPKENELAAVLAAARTGLTELSRDLDASRAQFAKLSAERSGLAAKIGNARRVLELSEDIDLAALVRSCAQTLASAESERLAVVDASNVAKAENEVDAQEVQSAHLLAVGLAAEANRVEGEIASMRARWSQAGLGDDPSEMALQNAILSLANQQAVFAEASLALKVIAAGLEEWQRLDMTRKLEAELGAEANGASIDDHTDRLRDDVVTAQHLLQAARDAHDASDKLAAAVKEIGDDFGSSAIAPFGEVFKSFLCALVRDSRFHRVSPEFGRVRGGGNVLYFNLDLGEPTSGFQVEMVLSEGQLSEVSLAAMLAASCIYPWSRWRGMLLDDPTQYQDLTHTTSLFDVLRNLALDAGFQVVVAVHDRGQADFLVRKLVSASVPYVECEYLAMGPQGALTRISGSAAR